jgi:hypothetical protein
MKVNFNNLRAQAAYRLDDLIKKLNAAKLSEQEWKEVDGQWISGDILLKSEDIQEDLDSLRMLIISIASVYDEDNPGFADMYEHIKKNGGVANFNDPED